MKRLFDEQKMSAEKHRRLEPMKQTSKHTSKQTSTDTHARRIRAAISGSRRIKTCKKNETRKEQ